MLHAESSLLLVAQTAQAFNLFKTLRSHINCNTLRRVRPSVSHLWSHATTLDARESVFQRLPEMKQSGAAAPPACSAVAGSGCWSSSLWWALTLGKLWSLPAHPLDTDRNPDQHHMTEKMGATSYWQNTLDHLLITSFLLFFFFLLFSAFVR